jgi:hypothetical protein
MTNHYNEYNKNVYNILVIFQQILVDAHPEAL